MSLNPNNTLNFSGGPGALPDVVLNQVQQAIINVPEVGLSILGISHRSAWFENVVRETENNIRTLLGLLRIITFCFYRAAQRSNSRWCQ